MSDRRKFLKHSLQAIGATTLSSLAIQSRAEVVSEGMARVKQGDLATAVRDTESWAMIKQAFTVAPYPLNLNNGGVSPQPRVVQETVERYYRMSNEGPTYYMWQILDRGREALRHKLADLAGATADEVAIQRNATEALANITFGLPLKAGDEVIMTRQDYPNMINAWKQREKRDGIKIIWLNLQLPSDSEEQIVSAFIKATTPKTRVWHITHMINWTGQLLPAKRLCEEARKRSILSIVDAAHSFAQVQYKISEMNPDYLGTSLHKWLCAPFGTGMLYVKKSNIAGLWPLLPGENPQSDDIRKFETLGTRSFAPEHAISQAIDFHLAIGADRKEERLRYLKNYWSEQVKDIPKVSLCVSLKPEFSCALGSFAIEGMEPDKISSRLIQDFQIHAVAIKWENISCVRVTPHVYTLEPDLDRLVTAIKKIATT